MAKTETSFVTKLTTIAVGETIYVDDFREAEKPIFMDKYVQAAMVRDQRIAGRRFITERMVAVRMSPVDARPILAITRTE